MLTYTKEELRSPSGKEKEWILTNGLGGYASSTLSSLNTRKYHGLLISALNPPTQRYLQLSKIEEEITFPKAHYSLGYNKYPNIYHPEGYKHLLSFTKTANVTSIYSLPELHLEKTISLPRNTNATLISYKILSKKEATLLLKPFITCRSIHELKHHNQLSFKQQANSKTTVLKTSQTGLPILLLGTNHAHYKKEEFWINTLEYEEEQARGYDYQEDLFVPGTFIFPIKKGLNKLTLLAAGGRHKEAYTTFNNLYNNRSQDLLLAQEETRINNIIQETYHFNNLKKDPLIHHLAQAADSFLVKRTSTNTIIAGYPWFTDWGRDALISLPGLCLVTGRIQEAQSILTFFAKHLRKGLVPNFFSETNESSYQAVDTSLWFIHAVYKFIQHTNNYTFVHNELWPTMKNIITHYIHGTDNTIFMDKDHLLSSGDASTALTWMDAKIENTPASINITFFMAIDSYRCKHSRTASISIILEVR